MLGKIKRKYTNPHELRINLWKELVELLDCQGLNSQFTTHNSQLNMKVLYLFFSLLIMSQSSYSNSTLPTGKEANGPIFQIRLYHLKDNNQINITDNFLKRSYMPALDRLGIKNIGVFKPITNDTASDKLIYVLIPFTSLNQWLKINDRLNQDPAYKSSAENFLHADAKNPAFQRMESILLQAFSGQTFLNVPKQKDPDRIFELRSYESPT